MIDILLLFFLVICAIVAIEIQDILSGVIILGAYSLIMCVVWTRLNAVDVAFTEAAVGAGITSVLVLAALSRTTDYEDRRRRRQSLWSMLFPDPTDRRRYGKILANRIFSLMIVVITGVILAYGTLDMPDFGDPQAPAHRHVAPEYIQHSYEKLGIINFVTNVLAAYRGYDTLGEVTVIFTAGVCTIMLLRRKGRS